MASAKKSIRALISGLLSGVICIALGLAACHFHLESSEAQFTNPAPHSVCSVCELAKVTGSLALGNRAEVELPAVASLKIAETESILVAANSFSRSHPRAPPLA